MDTEKLELLKSLHLLDKIPERQLAALGEFLKTVALKDGELVFEEASKGNSLFFVTSGHIAISKRVSGSTFKDLAILSPGDCFGEMVLFEQAVRSARAWARGAAVVFELGRDDLDRWLKAHPELAMAFFTELVQVQSNRLRRTSTELTLLCDLSHILLEPFPSGGELLAKVLAHIMPHLEGAWSAAAYLYNVFNDEMDLSATAGAHDFGPLAPRLPSTQESSGLWIDERVYYVSLPGAKRPLGYLIFHAPSRLEDEERVELSRTLAAVARLLTAALVNIEFRTEEALRTRLKSKTYGSTL